MTYRSTADRLNEHRRYAEDGDCRWVTIGAKTVSGPMRKGEKRKKAGGAKVCIGPGGKIKKGPGNVEGKDVDTLDKNKEPGSSGGPPKKEKAPAAPAAPTNTAKDSAERMKRAKEAAKTRKEWGNKEQPFFRPGPNPTVDMVLTRTGPGGDKQVLLIKRREGEGVAEGGKWALPGGFVDSTAGKGEFWDSGETESPEDAAFRELTEETGLSADQLRESVREVGKFDRHGRDPRDNDEAWSESTAFTLDVSDMAGSGKVQGLDDAEAAEWVNLSEIEGGGREMAFDHRDILDDASMASPGYNPRAKMPPKDPVKSAAAETRRQLDQIAKDRKAGKFPGNQAAGFIDRVISDQDAATLRELAKAYKPRSREGRAIARALAQKEAMDRRSSTPRAIYAKCKPGQTAAKTDCEPADGSGGGGDLASEIDAARGIPKDVKAELKGGGGSTPAEVARAMLDGRHRPKNKAAVALLEKIAAGPAEEPKPEPEAPKGPDPVDAAAQAQQTTGQSWPSVDKVAARMGGKPREVAAALADAQKEGRVRMGKWNRNLVELKDHPAADFSFVRKLGGGLAVGYDEIEKAISSKAVEAGAPIWSFARPEPRRASASTYDSACRWITIGGGKDDEGNPKGGARVCIGEGGKIAKGPGKIAGKDVDNLDRNRKPGSKGGPPEKPRNPTMADREKALEKEEGQAMQRVDHLSRQLEMVEARLDAAGRDKPLRPDSGPLASRRIPDRVLRAVAEHEGKDHTVPGWWDKLDPEVVKEAKLGLIKGSHDATVTNLKKRRAALRRELAEAEQGLDEVSAGREKDLGLPFSDRTYAAGQPCKPGQNPARDKCIPKGKEAGGQPSGTFRRRDAVRDVPGGSG